MLPSLTASPVEPPKMRVTRPVAMVSLKPIVGGPATFSQALIRQLNEAALRENIALLVDADARGSHALSGFLVINANAGAVRLTHVWDVVNANGERIARISGEENVRVLAAGQDTWAAVSPALVAAIADKVITRLSADVRPAAPLAAEAVR